MNAIVKTNSQVALALPASLAALFGDVSAHVDDLSGGVQSGFPVISYRGKVWRIRKGGTEENYTDSDGDAVQSLSVVLVKSNPIPSKLYYDTAFEEGSIEKPRCWSSNGITPDKGVVDPISPICQTCPNNVWGSKINEDTGAKGRLCADTRRIAMVTEAELVSKGEEASRCLLRIPPASLNPLKEYAEKVLKPKGIPYFAVVTKIGFDTQVAYPKLTFKATRFLTEPEAQVVLALQASSDVKSILNEPVEFEGSPAAAAGAEPEIAGSLPASMATATATPAAAAPRASAAAQEAVGTLAETPAAQPTAAPAVKRGRPAKAKPVSTPAQAPAAAVPAAAATSPPAASGGDDDFDKMLDSLLG